MHTRNYAQKKTISLKKNYCNGLGLEGHHSDFNYHYQLSFSPYNLYRLISKAKQKINEKYTNVVYT